MKTLFVLTLSVFAAALIAGSTLAFRNGKPINETERKYLAAKKICESLPHGIKRALAYENLARREAVEQAKNDASVVSWAWINAAYERFLLGGNEVARQDYERVENDPHAAIKAKEIARRHLKK